MNELKIEETSLKPASDEVASYQAKTRKKPASQPITPRSINTTKSNWGLRTITSMILIILVLLCVEIIWPLKQQLEYLQNDQGNIKQQMQSFNLQLERTGASANLSDKTIQTRISDIDFEIRKLWDLANKRNRQQILEQQKQLSTQLQKINAQTQLVRQLEATNQNQNDQLTANLNNINELGKSLNTMQDTINKQIVALQSSNDKLSKALAKTEEGLNKQTLNEELENRLENNERAISAIDTYRRQINTTLAQLKASINSLNSEIAQINNQN